MMGNKRYVADEIGQTNSDPAERLRELEAENARLRRAVAVLTLDELVLKEVIEENGLGGGARK